MHVPYERAYNETKADMPPLRWDVRFTRESGHRMQQR